MNLPEAFNAYIRQERLFQPKDRLLLAVSGGVDSVVLCELCRRAGYDFIIAHCNFQLRGAESDRDEAFVRQLGEQYGVPVQVKRMDTTAYRNETGKGIQEAARALRYEWFRELAAQWREAGWPVHIVTAHHLDDNIETVLMNFFKGTGVQGLRGILPRQDNLIRPLLFARKEILRTFAEANRLEYVEDSSNLTDKYTRNYFRNRLIPALQQVFPQVEENLAGNIARFRESALLYQQAIEMHKSKLLVPQGKEMHIPVLKLKKAVPLKTILYEIIRVFGFTVAQIEEVIGLLDSDSGKYVRSATHRIIRNRRWLIIAPLPLVEASLIVINKGEEEIMFENGKLVLKTLSATQHTLSVSPLAAQLDARYIRYPLLLRKWKQGDYFYPLGMSKKKKLSRFFIDQKLSLTEKEKIWVLEMDKKILWVIGLRIDNRFKITPSTQQVLQVRLLPE